MLRYTRPVNSLKTCKTNLLFTLLIHEGQTNLLTLFPGGYKTIKNKILCMCNKIHNLKG